MNEINQVAGGQGFHDVIRCEWICNATTCIKICYAVPHDHPAPTTSIGSVWI